MENEKLLEMYLFKLSCEQGYDVIVSSYDLEKGPTLSFHEDIIKQSPTYQNKEE